jgi:transposase-like protein/predicted nucleic acid-binding Zn finger protein
MTAFFQTREQLGIQLATAGNSIVKITKNHYKVKSQSTARWYIVKKLQDADVWTCECADFMYRLSKNTDKKCKHIIAIQTLEKTFQVESKIEPVQHPQVCPRCSSNKIVKNGFRNVMNEVRRQRRKCDRCGYRFIIGENGFSKVSSNPHIIVETLNLFMGGMSLRNISRHVFSTHQVKISHVSIMNWVRKYTALMKDYVDKLIPEYHEVWSVDEMMLNVKGTEPMGKGYYSWVWSIINPQTRFVVATELSKRRDLKDAKRIFEIGKERVESVPTYIITDALRTYEPAIRKQFDLRRTAHIKTKSLSEGFANRPIERWHNEVRENTKTRRGLGNDESAQVVMDLVRINHNYCRPHAGLPNKITPAEAAGINLKLGDNKLKELIAKSAEAKAEAKKEYRLEPQLGKRIDYVVIKHEADCVSVKPKGWIPKPVWREINDVLFINGFSWLENGKESQWIRMR